MKKKIEVLINRLKLAVRKHPVEVVLSVVFSLAGCVYFEYAFGYSFLAAPLAYFPVLFLITYILNGLTVQHKLRPLYFLSAFFFSLINSFCCRSLTSSITLCKRERLI